MKHSANLIEILNEVLVACENNPEKPFESVFSRGEAGGYINQAIQEINQNNDKSSLWMEFLLKLLILDIGVRESFEKKPELIQSLVNFSTINKSESFRLIHIELVRFFYHYYGSEATGFFNEIKLLEECISHNSQKSLDLPDSAQKLNKVSTTSFPQKPNPFVAQKSLLVQLQDLQKRLQKIEDRSEKLQNTNIELQKRNSELHYRNEDLFKENSVLKKNINELAHSIQELNSINQSLQKRCGTLQNGSFEELHHANEQLKSLAEISSASFCTVSGLRDFSARVCISSSFTITVRCRDGHKLCRGGDPFQVSIQGPLSTIPSCITDNDDGTYLVKYTPLHQGTHKVSVTLRGKNIQDSPFEVNVFRDYTLINPSILYGCKGREDGQLNLPYGVAVDSHNHILVADTDNQRIQIFDHAGHFIRKFGTFGEELGELNYPYDVAVDSQENILVADWGNHRVQVFDRNGHYFFSFGSKGKTEGHFEHPCAIHVDRFDNIYVADQNQVQVFDKTYRFCVSLVPEKSFHQEDHIWIPSGIATDSQGRIIVSDSNSHQLYIFDQEGELLLHFGRYGSGEGEFKQPWGVTVDSGDNIVVSDRENHRIQVFDKEGKYLTHFSHYGCQKGELNTPLGIAITMKGEIIVAEYHNHRIQIF